MRTSLKNRTSGFTIIEVLIVLAIAGLIMLIVFLAVPALQRNSRNTTSRNEAAGLLGAVSEFTSNNNGKLPAASVSSTSGSDAEKVFANAKTQNILTITVEGEAGTTVPSTTSAVIATQAKCASATATTVDAAGRASITSAGAGRQVAIIYRIENSSGDILACTEG